jgi:tRNA (guanine37-N1)-methyltransferase
LTQTGARRLSRLGHIAVLCGRYEGFDERVRERVTEEVSIGDYVLTGGELPALVVLDAIARFVPGVVGDEQSVAEDSFSRGLLDFPQYTRPAEVAVRRAGSGESSVVKVPDVLLSGNHAEIRRWRRREALSRTLERRPDLLASAELDEEERQMLRELVAARTV